MGHKYVPSQCSTNLIEEVSILDKNMMNFYALERRTFQEGRDGVEDIAD